MNLLPRLDKAAVATLSTAIEKKKTPPQSAFGVIDKLELRPHWNLSGGVQTNEADLKELAKQMMAVAFENGFPKPPTLQDQQKFDREAGRILAQSETLKRSMAETQRAECWAGLTALYFLDLAIWRHANPRSNSGYLSVERLKGGNRNFLRRLWLRNQAFVNRDDQEIPDWDLIDHMTEDALRAVIDRPSLSTETRLVSALGRTWLAYSKKGFVMEALMRDVSLRIRAHAECREFSELSDDELEEFVQETFKTVSNRLYPDRSADIPTPVSIQTESVQSPKVEERNKAVSDSPTPDDGFIFDFENMSPNQAATVEKLGRARNLLSPKASGALKKLQSGDTHLRKSERNALRHLQQSLVRFTERA